MRSRTRGHQRKKDVPQGAIDLTLARHWIASARPARPVEIARPSRRVNQRNRACSESRRGMPEPAGERIAGRLLQPAERDTFEDQRALRGVDDRKVQKILADVDAYKCRRERPDEWSDSLSG
jgi:hypothetical protein